MVPRPRHVFEAWLDRFIDFVAPRRGYRPVPGTDTVVREPVLLLLDQHSSHTTIASLEKAAAHDVVIFALVPHASHILQPLDVACFRSWHTNYGAALRLARSTNPTLTVTKENFPLLMREPWAKALSSANGIAGFEATGLFPFNPDRVLVRFKNKTITPHDAVRPRTEIAPPSPPPPPPPPLQGFGAPPQVALGPSPPVDEAWDENTAMPVVVAAAQRYQALYHNERTRRLLTPPQAPPRAKPSRAGAIRAERAYSGAELLALQREAQKRKVEEDAAKAAAAAQRQAVQQERAAAKEARQAAARERAQARTAAPPKARGSAKGPAAASIAASAPAAP